MLIIDALLRRLQQEAASRQEDLRSGRVRVEEPPTKEAFTERQKQEQPA